MAVRVERDGPVTTVINDRINARNAGDPETADALTAAFLAFDADPEARVAVFWGAGGAFCAGWDLRYAASLADRDKFEAQIVKDSPFRKARLRRPAARWGPRGWNCPNP
jgi:enoyl-CoA hydratase